jgi:hypothetical protein
MASQGFSVRLPTPEEVITAKRNGSIQTPNGQPVPGLTAPPRPVSADQTATPAPAAGGFQQRMPTPEEAAMAKSPRLDDLPVPPSFGSMRPPPTPPNVGLDRFVRQPTEGLLNTMDAARRSPGFTPKEVTGVSREILPTTGSIIGGTLGAREGPAGAVAGSTMGAGFGDLASMVVETAVGAPPSLSSVADRFTSSTATGAASEIGGQFAGKVLGKVAAPFANKVTAAGRQAAEYLGGHITPAQMADSPFLATLENITKNSFLGSGRYRDFITKQNEILTTKVDQLLNQYGSRAGVEEAGKVYQAAGRRAVGAATQGAEAQAAGQLGQAQSAHQAAQAGLEGATQSAQTARGDLLKEYGDPRGPEATGRLWQNLQRVAHEGAKEHGSALYAKVDELAQGVQVPLTSLRDFAEQELARYGELGAALEGGKGVSAARKVMATGKDDVEGDLLAGINAVPGNDMAKAALSGMRPDNPQRQMLLELMSGAGIGAEDGVSFEQAHRIRSTLSQMSRDAARTGNSKVKGIADQLSKRIDDAMTEAAGGTDTPLSQAYREASGAWKTMADTYERGMLAQVARREPRVVVDTMIRPGRVADIAKAKAAVGEDGWKAIQSEHLHDLLTGPDGNPVDAKTLTKRLVALRPETIEAVYGKDGLAKLGGLQGMLATVAERQAGVEAASKGLTLAEKAAGKAKPPDLGIPHLDSDPHTVLAKIIQPNSIEAVERAKALVGPEDWAKVQSAHAQQILQGDGDKLVTGDVLMNRLNKLSRETMDATYGRSADGFYQLARVMEQLEKKEGIGTGRVAIQLTQGGTVTGLMLGKMTKAAGAVLVGPMMLGRIMVNPVARQYLTTGLRATAAGDSATAGRVGANLLGFLVREGYLQSRGAAPPAPTDAPAGRGPGPRAGGPPMPNPAPVPGGRTMPPPAPRGGGD